MPIIDSTQIDNASKRLQNDDVVAIPTETVYGLAASIASEVALRKVFSLKKRPFFDPLIVHVAGFKQAQSIVKEWPPLADFIAREFWPGPLTLVLPKADSVSSLITSGLETVAVRYPKHELAQRLIKLVGTPLAAPSANRFGKTSPSEAAHVLTEFPDEPLLILDGGACEVGLESTVVSFSEQGKIKILRPGGITEEQLRLSLQRWSEKVEIELAYGQETAAPGHLKHHYMPEIPLLLISENESIENTLKRPEVKAIAPDLKSENVTELIFDLDATVAARQLYSELRRLANLRGIKALYVQKKSSQTGGHWDAIWDRIGRAATFNFS